MPTTRWASNLILIAVVGILGCGGGSETSPPVCGLSASTLNFGSVEIGQTNDLTLTITNMGQGTLAGTLAENCPDYSIQGNASYSLSPGASDTLTIRFAPTVAGTRNCTLSVGSGCPNVSLTGVATTGPCGVAPTAIAFGVVPLGAGANQTFTITNNGPTTLDGTVSSPCPLFTIQGTASYSLAPAASATITVRFTPQTGGTASCTIETGHALCSDVTVSGSALELNSPSILPGGTYVHTFQGAGSFPYHCDFHPAMTAAVTVDPNSSVMSASVSIVSSSSTGFQPRNLTVAPGAVVTWTNNHNVPHTVTSN